MTADEALGMAIAALTGVAGQFEKEGDAAMAADIRRAARVLSGTAPPARPAGDPPLTEAAVAALTLADAERLLGNAVYAATGLVERLEAAGKVGGDGHHARQHMAGLVVEDLRRRWLAGVT